MEHEIQREIILKLIHKPKALYSELLDKKHESNLFAYHLRRLQEQGLVEKQEEGYSLTTEGKKLSAFIEGDTGGKAELPTPTVVISVRKGDMLLAQQRLKEPFYGHWSWVSGKINKGWNPAECAVRDLKEETDLETREEDLLLRAVEHVKTFENGVLIHHHLIWSFETWSFSGTLKERTHKAINRFMTVAEYRACKRFPGSWFLDNVMPNKDFFIIDAERYMKDGEFTEYRLIRAQRFGRKEKE